ncbi:MAG: nitronate monooxygenase, partial [Gammaproteobacteria bacterium]
MQSAINELLGIEFPLVAFTHCRDVVVEVSKAGGMGVLGATAMTAEQLEIELAWIDDHIEGKPYGVDLIVPTAFESKGESIRNEEMVSRIPDEHRDFVRNLLDEYGIDPSILTDSSRTSGTRFTNNIREDGAAALLDVAFSHPIKLIANALGTPPKYMLERSKALGIPVAALIGTKEQAIKQVEAGVDILVAAGGEAGGHCGD